MPKPTGPSTPKKVAGPGPLRHHERLTRFRFTRRIPIRQPLEDATAVAGHYAILGWNWYTIRTVARWFDWLAIPAILWTGALLTGVWWLWPTIGTELWVIWYAWMREQHRNGTRVMPKPLARFDEKREIRAVQKLYDAHIQNPRIIVLGVTHKRYSDVHACRIPESYKTADFANLPDVLTPAIGSFFSLTFPPRSPSIMLVHKHTGDAFAHDPERPALDKVVDGQIPLGIDKDGERIDIRLYGNRFVLAGRPNSGKSTTTNSMLAYAFRLPHIDVRLYDAKGGMDMRWAWPYCTRVAVHNDDALAMLEDAHDDLLIRQAKLGMQGRSMAAIGPDCPLVLIVLDEFMSLLTPASPQKADKDRAYRAALLVREIARLGRAAGFVPWLAQQDLYKRELPAGLIGKFNMRLGFAVEAWQESEMILPGSTTAGHDLSKIPTDRSGQGVLVGTPTRFLPIRTFRLFDPALTWEAQQLSRSVPRSLSEPPRQVSAPTPAEVLEDVSQSHTDPNPPTTALTTDQLEDMVAGKLRAAGRSGVKLLALAETFQVADHRVKTVLNRLRRKQLAECRGREWYWTGEP